MGVPGRTQVQCEGHHRLHIATRTGLSTAVPASVISLEIDKPREGSISLPMTSENAERRKQQHHR